MHPQALVGYSLGEYVAACLAGVFSLEDALKMVAERARMIESLPSGSLLAVGLSEDEIAPLLGDELSIMAVNGPAQCVASGPAEAIDALQSRLEANGVVYRRLQASHAFHSKMMLPLFDSVVELARSIELKSPQIPYLSNVTGEWIRREEATDPTYWARHMCQPVRFSEGVEELLKDNRRVFLEAGPPLLSSIIQQRPSSQEEPPVTLNLMRHSYETVPDLAYTLQALGKLFLLGARPNWASLHADERRLRVSLPTYPFQRNRYWIDAQADRQYIGNSASRSEWFYVPSWKRMLPPVSTNETSRLQWWIFIDESGIGESLADHLDSAHRRITRIYKGDAFKVIAQNSYTVRPTSPEDFISLIAEDEPPEALVYLWGLPTPRQKTDRQAAGAETEGDSVLNLLALKEGLQGLSGEQSLRIWVVTDSLHDVTGDELLDPHQADLLGVCTAMGRDLPDSRITNLDVARRDQNEQETSRLVAQILKDIGSDISDRVIAYRGAHRWIPTLVTANVESADRVDQITDWPRNWLVINGLNSIGFAFCEYLSKNGGGSITLVEPSGFPAREMWDEWVAKDTGEGLITSKIKRIRTLEASNKVQMLSADLSNIDETLALLDESGRLSDSQLGVLYIFEPDSVSADFDTNSLGYRLLRSRYKSLSLLDEALRERELAFKLLVSNTRTTGTHSAADDGFTLFLDSFANDSARNGHQPWTSVTWDVSLETGNGQVPEAVRRLLHIDRTPQVIVSLDPLAEGWSKVGALMTVSASGAISEPIGHYPRPNLRVAYVPPRNATEEAIAQIWRELLGVDKIGVHDNFLELGGDSLLAVRLISRMRDTFQQELSMGLIFEASSIAELSKAVVQKDQKDQDDELSIEELMKMVDQFSEEEVEQELLKRRQSPN